MAIAVREFGRISTVGRPAGLDRQVVSALDFDFLKSIAMQPKPLTDAFRLTADGGHEALQVQNFVGVVSLPSGEQLEIVPKTAVGEEALMEGRLVLLKMLSTVAKLEFREGGLAALGTLDRPWLEVLISHVLSATAKLLRSGLRKSYSRAQAEEPFLRGQLSIAAQLRQRPGRQHLFHVSYDEYTTNRPENRLLRSALEQIKRWSQDSENQRLCRELLFVMDEVPKSQDIAADFGKWSNTRDMVQYKALLPWLRLILTNQSPIFSEGRWEGISLLFPMEQLFEAYVAQLLERQVQRPYVLKAQMRKEYLVVHQGASMFRLQPDLVILERSIPVSVLDTKWKLVDDRLSAGSNKYELSQADFYQLFAYGEKYLGGRGDLFLIFPRHSLFRDPLPEFAFTDELRLWVIPVDLSRDEICWPEELSLPYVSRESRSFAA